MTREEVLAKIEQVGIVPAIRVHSTSDALFAAEALLRGGIPILEIPMTVPDAAQVIAELCKSQPGVIVGAGTVLDLDTADACLEAGAGFLTSPGLDIGIVEFARKHKLAVIPGALTPSEIMAAMRADADFLKIFPCSSLGGASYIRALKRPFPAVRLIASGGVSQATASDFIRAGASALGIGQEILPREAIRQRSADWIRELARRFLGIVQEARGHT